MAALTVNGLRKTYQGRIEALKGVSFTVKQGEFFGLLGPNGAGKTTAIGIITDLVRRSGGSAKVFGHEAGSEEAKQAIGLAPQEFNFSIFERCEDIVVQQAGYYAIPRKEAKRRAERHLRQLGLWEKRDEQVRFLSGGMKRKLLIVRALLHQPTLLILDEPTAGVDVETRRELWDFFTQLNKEGVTIILTTHNLEEAEELCKRIAIIDKGRIIEDTTTKQLLAKLEQESFLLDTKDPVTKTPKGFTKVEEQTLRADLQRGESLNQLLKRLDKAGITITSMRTRRNRLEELFVRLTRK